jgi:hypothetical protein
MAEYLEMKLSPINSSGNEQSKKLCRNLCLKNKHFFNYQQNLYDIKFLTLYFINGLLKPYNNA